MLNFRCNLNRIFEPNLPIWVPNGSVTECQFTIFWGTWLGTNWKGLVDLFIPTKDSIFEFSSCSYLLAVIHGNWTMAILIGTGPNKYFLMINNVGTLFWTMAILIVTGPENVSFSNLSAASTTHCLGLQDWNAIIRTTGPPRNQNKTHTVDGRNPVLPGMKETL